jgi:PP-loop superfamily ATP-utilizing enzyme
MAIGSENGPDVVAGDAAAAMTLDGLETLAHQNLCARCIMPESPPYITLDDEGICNLCHEHDQAQAQEDARVLESDFIKLINKYKGKHKYECLCMCSGGKDSTSALYYMVKRYKLNPLAFTFDHGFESDEALENIHRAVDALGVDFLFFKSSYMHDMFAKILKTGSRAVICHPCSMWYMDLAFDVAARYDIPLIVAGWTKGQSQKQGVMSKCGCNSHAPEFKAMAEATVEFLSHELDDMAQYKKFPRSMEEVLKRANKRHKAIVVSPHWFLPYDQDQYVATIKDELGWRAPAVSYPGGSTNCLLNFISVYNSMKHFGYTHYHVEMSKLIRQGVMTRGEALEALKLNFDKALLNAVAEKLDYQF